MYALTLTSKAISHSFHLDKEHIHVLKVHNVRIFITLYSKNVIYYNNLLSFVEGMFLFHAQKYIYTTTVALSHHCLTATVGQFRMCRFHYFLA